MSGNERFRFEEGNNNQGPEQGAVLVFVALGLVILLGMVGLTFDLGHAYINKGQLQNMADACALAGASALDGTSAGLNLAESRATDTGGYLNNRYDFGTQTVSIPTTAVTYSTALAGPWLDKAGAQGVADNIRFVRVIVPPQDTKVFFGKVVPGVPGVLNFGAQAVAGNAKPLDTVCTGLDPFSPAAMDRSNGNGHFGFVPGQIYALRLSPGNSGKIDCASYFPGSQEGNFGWADPCKCGNSTPCIQGTLLSGCRPTCTQVNLPSLDATPGNKGNAALKAVKDRFAQDDDQSEYYSYPAGWNQYQSTSTNHRRVIRVAINDPVLSSKSEFYVLGFGCFWMAVYPGIHPPSDEICMMYVGSCDLNGKPTGGTRASLTQIVLFR